MVIVNAAAIISATIRRAPGLHGRRRGSRPSQQQLILAVSQTIARLCASARRRAQGAPVGGWEESPNLHSALATPVEGNPATKKRHRKDTAERWIRCLRDRNEKQGRGWRWQSAPRRWQHRQGQTLHCCRARWATIAHLCHR